MEKNIAVYCSLTYILHMLSYEINNRETKKLQEINRLAQKKADFVKTLSIEFQEAMHRYARISTIGASTRIENAILTDSEIDWMDEILERDGRPSAFQKEKRAIENKISKDKERSIEEVAGCRNMLAIIYKQAQDLFPLTETSLKGLHKELMEFYPPASYHLGRYKIASNSVVERILETGATRDILRTADPGPITEAAMHDLVKWYNSSLVESPWPIAVACEFVFRFLAIHPFQDGNGRMGRALFMLILLQSSDEGLKTTIPYISIDRHIERNREEYYLVLKRCSEGKFLQNPNDYKIEYFLKFMLKVIEEAIQSDIDFYHGKCIAFVKLPQSQRKVLSIFKEHPEKKLSPKDISAEIKIPERTLLHALEKLIEKGFLQKIGTRPSVWYQLTF